jgi:hypothetical protein
MSNFTTFKPFMGTTRPPASIQASSSGGVSQGSLFGRLLQGLLQLQVVVERHAPATAAVKSVCSCKKNGPPGEDGVVEVARTFEHKGGQCPVARVFASREAQPPDSVGMQSAAPEVMVHRVFTERAAVEASRGALKSAGGAPTIEP